MGCIKCNILEGLWLCVNNIIFFFTIDKELKLILISNLNLLYCEVAEFLKKDRCLNVVACPTIDSVTDM